MTPEQAVAIMTIQERESFLAEARVGVLGVAAGSGRGPVLVPVWYHYRPGRELTVLTERGSRKAALIRAAGQISLCVQTEQPPYRYVSVRSGVGRQLNGDHGGASGRAAELQPAIYGPDPLGEPG
jgi:nitroimidazol reductase NimA-like FMN-containing flavoprotein (pyridoxamine 5'-phosphate oxidase superfamily)